MQTRPYGKSFLRVLFFSLMAALGLTSLVPTAEASRVNVFEHELGAFGHGHWTPERGAGFHALLTDNDIDFGYFAGTKGAMYFTPEWTDYTVDKRQFADNNIAARTLFTYKTDKYDLVQLGENNPYDVEINANNFFVAYLVRDKVTGVEYLCIHVSGTAFSVKSGKLVLDNFVGFETLKDRCLTSYPNARLMVFHPGSANYAKTYSKLLEYLNGPTYMGLTNLVSETTAGGLHVDTNLPVTVAYSLKDKIFDAGYSDYPFVATVAYPHDVKFTDDDGTLLQRSFVNDGEPATAPANPSKPGFDFIGWNPSDFTKVTNDMTIVATYQAAAGSAIVTFKDEDAVTVVESKSVKTGETVTPPDEPPTKEGHTLEAWLKDGDPYDFATPVTASFDLIASFTANVYTVTFQYEDGEVIKTQHVEYLEDAEAPANPSPKKAGQIFFRWSRDFTAVSEDLVVTALFLDRQTNVGTAEDFLEYVGAGLPSDATLTLTNDLSFAGLDFTPADFSATLDGNGRAITGLSDKPLFAILSGCVRNLTIRDCAWSKTDTTASFLAATARGAMIDSCQIDGCSAHINKSNIAIGGFAVNTEADDAGNGTTFTNCVVRNCAFTTAAASGVIVGGFVRTAKNDTLFVDCVMESTNENAVVGGRDLATGGIAGESICSTFVRCCNSVKVKVGYKSDCFAGGIVGRCASDNSGASSKPSVFIACTNLAEVLNVGCDGCSGGIAGGASKTDMAFRKCLNRGAITMAHHEESTPSAKHKVGNGVGGILGGIYYGVALGMSDCVNYGTVSEDHARSAGGLVGGANSNSDGAELKLFMTNCVNHGSVTGGYAVGGMIGMQGSIFAPEMINCGNTGALSCPTGSVGGVYGILYGGKQNNTKSFTLDEYKNVMNCGEVMSESGYAGGWVGTFVGGDGSDGKGNNYTLAPTNLVLTTAVTAGEGGVASNLIANIVLRGRTVTVADADTHCLAPQGFTNGQAKRILNDWVKAQETVYPRWVQAKEWLDLEIFSSERKFFVYIIR